MDAPTGRFADDLLGPADPPPVAVINPDSAVPLVIHCDHGGNAIPAALKSLGLTDDALARHIAWDIGAAAVAERLARRIGAPAVLARYSRLLVDPNRAAGDPEMIPAISDGIAIPGNAHLSDAAIAARLRAAYWPYHQAIDAQIGRLRRRGVIPLVVSVHSFTPALLGSAAASARPWHVGVMFDRDERLSRALIAGLRARGGLVVGENQPYSGITHGYCLKAHGLAQGLPHAQIEIRQDLICTAAGQGWWAGVLAEVLRPILADDDLRAIMHA
ncbi:MAG: N-formylglutamate amidohydrolase [Rhodospirillaceae bacterium]|nr:N-formylglutamate amidohydrolase [Rhodospirillaceae bacterium]